MTKRSTPQKDPQGRSVRVFVDAHEAIIRIAEAHKMSQTDVLSALVRWFDLQPRSVQAVIMGTLDEELRQHATGQIVLVPE